MTKTFKILMVDDDEDDQLLVKHAFEEDSDFFQLAFVNDGSEAISLIDNPKLRPDLILLDVNLPRVNGFEILAHLRKSGSFRDTPVIMLSTSSMQNDIDKAYRLGANSYIVKPASHDSLLLFAKRIREFWFSLVRLPSHQLE